jgi:hypothetical protein
MKKLLLLLILLSGSAVANQRYNGICQQSGKVVLSGLNSTNNAELAYGGATVTVSIVGGGLATLFSDNSGTPLANPFTAASDATFSFYVANGRYSVVCTGTGVPTITTSDNLLNDPTGPSSFTSTFFSSATANPSATGVFRLASTDIGLCWRNNANSADICFTKTSGDVVQLNAGYSIGANDITAGTWISNTANVAGTGTERWASVDTAKIRNNANSLDLNLWSKNASDVLALGDAAGVSVQGMANSGNEVITGNLGVSGTLTAGAIVPMSLAVSGNATIGGTLGVTGATTLSSNATVDGTLGVTGNETVGGTLGVTGAITGASLNLGVTGVLSTTAQSGTGSLCMTTNCVMVTPTLGNASATSVVATAVGGGSGAPIRVQAAANAFMSYENTSAAADQKWWDTGVSGNVFVGRVVNDTNSSSANWVSVTRGAGATVGAITFGAGGGVQTLPTATDTLVGKATTDTLTNKTLGGTTPYNRMRANQGSALVVGDVGSLTNFGSTASVAAVSGTDAAGSVSILSGGTGQLANGSFVLTFHDGTWTSSPICIASRAEGIGPNSASVFASASATALSIGFDGIAVAGSTYIVSFICIGR